MPWKIKHQFLQKILNLRKEKESFEKLRDL